MAFPDPQLVLALVAAGAAGAALGLVGLRARQDRRARRAGSAARADAAARPAAASASMAEARWPPSPEAEIEGGLLALRTTPEADAALVEAMRRHLDRALPDATLLPDPASGRLLLRVAGGDDVLGAAVEALQAQLRALGALAWRTAGATGVFAAATPWPRGEAAARASARLDAGLAEAITRGAPRVFMQPLRRAPEQAVMLAPRFRPVSDRHGRGVALAVVEMPLPADQPVPAAAALDDLLAGLLALATAGRRAAARPVPLLLPADRASGAPADWGQRLVQLLAALPATDRAGLGVLVHARAALALPGDCREALAALAGEGLLLALALPPEGGGEDALRPAEPALVAFDMREWAAFERDPAVQAALRVQVARARRRGRGCLASGDGSLLQRLGFELAGVTLQADADTLGALDALDGRRAEAAGAGRPTGDAA